MRSAEEKAPPKRSLGGHLSELNEYDRFQRLILGGSVLITTLRFSFWLPGEPDCYFGGLIG